MLSFIENFIYRYFVVEGYDIVDTLTYGIVLGLCTFAIIPLLKRIGLRIDNRLIVTIIPFIIYGSTQESSWTANWEHTVT